MFPVGSSHVVLGGDPTDDVTIAAAGITVHEAIKAGAALEVEGFRVRVLDLYSVKPIDAAAIAAAGRETAGILCVEDHWAEGGLGDAVLSALAQTDVQCRVRKLAVTSMPMSGTPDELLGAAGIDAVSIQRAARELARGPTGSPTVTQIVIMTAVRGARCLTKPKVTGSNRRARFSRPPVPCQVWLHQ